MDTTTIVAKIGEAEATIVAVGTAVILIVAVAFAIRAAKSMLGR